jgi:hypothetical protein
MGRLGRRPRWLAAGAAAVLVIGGLLAWAVWPESEEPPRARQYLDFTACLLTPAAGTADPAAAPVWQGMQDASLATRAKVQYLAVTGPQTADNAATFLPSLAQGGCDLVFAAGAAPVGAVALIADRFPAVRFYAVGSARPTSGAKDANNVTTITLESADGVRERVAGVVRAAVGEIDR